MSGREPAEPAQPGEAAQAGEALQPGEAAQPGEVPAATRQRSRPLTRPPGERYLDGAPPGGPSHERRARDRPAPPVDAARTGPRLRRATVFGSAVAAVLAVAWVVPATLLDISAGLIVLAALCGWLIGRGVRLATWRGPPPGSHAAVGILGAGLAVAAWLGGTFLDYVVSLALLPASSLDLAQRLANEPFLAWLEPQLVPLKLLEVVAAALVGWRSAR